MKYGVQLIESLKKEIDIMQAAIDRRAERIANWETDEEDCFISQRNEERTISVNRDKIRLIEDGGCAWFQEYATLEGQLVKAKWCNTKFGYSLRAEMPDGKVVWTTADTEKGLAKRGLKKVECKRPAWFAFKSPYGGMMGVYCGDYELFPSAMNYATGEDAPLAPLEIRDI